MHKLIGYRHHLILSWREQPVSGDTKLIWGENMTDIDSFRASTRAWLEANCPPSMQTPMPESEVVWGGRNAYFKNPESKLWLETMASKGWTAPMWPKEYGGGGLTGEENRVLQDELRKIKARPRSCLSASGCLAL